MQTRADSESHLASQMPQQPGVYLMKDAGSTIIYIGKAKNLRKRVSSYFVGKSKMEWKTSTMVRKIKSIDYIVTENEIEAFLLESNLIKQYRPAFNIELKDQQRYTYLKVTEEPFPRLLVARRNRAGKFSGPLGSVYGPFVKGSSKFLTVGLLRKLFKIRTCDRLPDSPCLQYFIKNCDAPCIARVSQEQYMARVNSLKKILDGQITVERFSQNLREEMAAASSSRDYEQAREIRDTIYRLDNLLVRQRMEKATARNAEEEYVGIQRDSEKGIAHVMALRRSRGVISDRKKFQFDLVGDNSLSSFLLQYYSTSSTVPRVIFVNEKPESMVALEKSLEAIAGHRVTISVIEPGNMIRAGAERQIMELVMRNLSSYLERGYPQSLVELKSVLGMDRIPSKIDCFDISNLGTAIAVGACCRFTWGEPDKSMYRKFKVKTVNGQNDVAMISEIIRRRYRTGDVPGLIVIDGGKAHLAAARSALASMGLGQTPTIALAKENEEIYMPGRSDTLVLSRRSHALKLLQSLRDEAHRFGLAYNRNRRKITLL